MKPKKKRKMSKKDVKEKRCQRKKMSKKKDVKEKICQRNEIDKGDEE